MHLIGLTMDINKYSKYLIAAAGISTCVLLSACMHNILRTDLERFVERRELCDHFRGEISGEPNKNPERELEVNTALDKYCKGIDGQLASLKERYKADTSISAKLSTYEPIGGKLAR
jgi:hypothetical protein